MGPVDVLLNQVQYTNRKRIKDDLKVLNDQYKSLLPRIVEYVFNNGSKTKVISLLGTVPIYYQGSTVSSLSISFSIVIPFNDNNNYYYSYISIIFRLKFF